MSGGYATAYGANQTEAILEVLLEAILKTTGNPTRCHTGSPIQSPTRCSIRSSILSPTESHTECHTQNPTQSSTVTSTLCGRHEMVHNQYQYSARSMADTLDAALDGVIRLAATFAISVKACRRYRCQGKPAAIITVDCSRRPTHRWQLGDSGTPAKSLDEYTLYYLVLPTARTAVQVAETFFSRA